MVEAGICAMIEKKMGTVGVEFVIMVDEDMFAMNAKKMGTVGVAFVNMIKDVIIAPRAKKMGTVGVASKIHVNMVQEVVCIAPLCKNNLSSYLLRL